MELSAHRVTNVRVKVTIHDNFAVKDIIFIDGNGRELKIKMFGRNRDDIKFIIQETVDARENALC